MKLGIVFEGGGMRGAYTAGVIEAFLEQKLEADYVVGVSAGAINGISYLSGQRGRALRCNIEHAGDKRAAGIGSWLKTGSFFGMDFLFKDLPQMEPWNRDAAMENPCEFEIGTTSAETGKPVFFGKESLDEDFTIIRASSSLPLFSPPVEFEGHMYMDGGLATPIPFERALEKGCDYLVVVLTKPRDFVKGPEKSVPLIERVLSEYPNLIQAVKDRQTEYTREQNELKRLEAEGRAFVIAPPASLELSRIERDKDKLKAAARQGYLDGFNAMENLRAGIAARKAALGK